VTVGVAVVSVATVVVTVVVAADFPPPQPDAVSAAAASSAGSRAFSTAQFLLALAVSKLRQQLFEVRGVLEGADHCEVEALAVDQVLGDTADVVRGHLPDLVEDLFGIGCPAL
jgi:type II secretory pathway component PulK